jgi:hypothetical protein
MNPATTRVVSTAPTVFDIGPSAAAPVSYPSKRASRLMPLNAAAL